MNSVTRSSWGEYVVDVGDGEMSVAPMADSCDVSSVGYCVWVVG